MRSLLLLALVLLPVAAPAQVLRTLTSPHPEVSDIFGVTLAAVGGLDGDGTPDLAIGALDNLGTSPRDAGRVYLFSGASGNLVHELVSPNEEMDGFFGGGVASAGDLDGDGTPDVLVGATYEARGTRPNGGRAYAFSGATGTLIFELAVSADAPRVGNHIGYSLSGFAPPPIAGTTPGSVSGDVTGDGIPDLLLGDSDATVPSFQGDLDAAGRVYVLPGTDGSLVRILQSPMPVGPDDFEGIVGGQFGLHVAAVGDATGDGIADVAVYALGDDLRGGGQAWTVYLFSGATGTRVWTAVRPVVTGAGSDLGMGYGMYFAAIGDVDGDGVGDLVVGSQESRPAAGAPRGAAFILSGRTGALLRTLTSPEPVDGTFGGVVGAAGDGDGDGVPDVAVTDRGTVRVFSGVTGGAIRAYVSPNPEANGGFGGAVTTLGDLDGDGRSELVVSAYGEDVEGVPNAGRVYVFSGMPVAGEDAPPSAPGFTATVSPNPARSSATLSLRLAEASAVRVAVVDALGRVVRRLDAGRLPVGTHRLALDVDGLPPGVYVVRVAAGDGAASVRLAIGR